MTKKFTLTLLFATTLLTNAFADFKWDVGGFITEGYDDNITFAHSNKISDAITRVTLGLGLQQESKTSKLTLKAGLTETIYANHSSFTNLAEDIDATFTKALTEYDQVTITNGFRHAEEARSFEDSFGSTNGRYSTYKNDFGFDYNHTLSQQWKLGGKYNQSNIYYSRNDLTDSVQYAPGVYSEFAFDSANTLLTNYTLARREFKHGPHSTSNIINGGFRHFFTQQWSAEALAGVSIIDSFDHTRIVKPRYAAGITNDVDENTRINLNYTLEHSTTGYNQDIFNNWRFSLTMLRQLTARISGSLTAFYGQGEYTVSNIDDKLTGAAFGINYELTKKSSVMLNYSLENTKSNTSSRSYTRNFVQLGFKFLF